MAGHDHMGKIPCYIAYGKDGSVWFSSEMKTLIDDPGSPSTSANRPTTSAGETEGKMVRWYDPKWVTDVEYIPDRKADYTELRETVVDAVKNRLMADVFTRCSLPASTPPSSPPSR